VAAPASVVRAENAVEAAAELLAARVLRTIEAHGCARLAIPGGSAVDVIGPARARLGTGWKRVSLTWVDERCVALDSVGSNRGTAYRRGALDRAFPPGDELPLFVDGETGEKSVVRVEAELDARFAGRIDVVLLGMGKDGHVASLFPGWSSPPGARVAHVTRSPKAPAERVTLTRTLLDRADATLLFVTGEHKRRALEHLLCGDTRLPAHGLPGLVIVTDLHPEAS
jgi:6-phosphogluconolactonase